MSSQSAMLVFSPNGVSAHSRRGLVLFRPLTRSHRFRLSMGGSGGVAAAALSSCAGTPARWQKVESVIVTLLGLGKRERQRNKSRKLHEI